MVKLICGILTNNRYPFKLIIKELESSFGPMDFISPEIGFKYTHYYDKEMGNSISRYYCSFENLINDYELGTLKLQAIQIEKKYSTGNSRNINIDPGYISLANLVLASTKNFSHRIPLNESIYGEITLLYSKKEFHSLEWTYPDYKDPENIKYFLKIRDKLKTQTDSRS